MDCYEKENICDTDSTTPKKFPPVLNRFPSYSECTPAAFTPRSPCLPVSSHLIQLATHPRDQVLNESTQLRISEGSPHNPAILSVTEIKQAL